MKKRSLIIALSISLSIGLAVVIPELRDRQNAVGSLSQLSPKLKRTFTETKEFSPLPQPQNGDWLTAHKEPGQTLSTILTFPPQSTRRKWAEVHLPPAAGRLPEGCSIHGNSA